MEIHILALGVHWGVIHYVDVDAESHLCPQVDKCPKGFLSIGDGCYIVNAKKVNHKSALKFCSDYGARLVNPADPVQFRRVTQRFRHLDYYIGIYTYFKNDEWRYGHNGAIFDGGPGGNKGRCAKVNKWSGGIVAKACTINYEIVCELPKESIGAVGRRKPLKQCGPFNLLYPIGDKCYYYDPGDSRTWTDSQQVCHDKGGRLWEPKSLSQYTKVTLRLDMGGF